MEISRYFAQFDHFSWILNLIDSHEVPSACNDERGVLAAEVDVAHERIVTHFFPE